LHTLEKHYIRLITVPQFWIYSTKCC